MLGLKFKDIKLSHNYVARTRLVSVLVGLGFALILARVSYIALLPSDLHKRLINQSSRQSESDITLAPPRAQIVDRNGRTLAVSILKPSLFLVPKRLPKDKATLKQVASRLGISLATLEDFGHRKSFVWVSRKMTPEQEKKLGDISEWKDFLGIIEEPKRFYPEKELAAHLLGFVGVDNVGLEGIESVFNTELTGEAETARVTRDARGMLFLTVPNGAVRPEPRTKPLRLSIDLSIQGFAESALRDGVLKARGRGGSAVVMDVVTGEVLAIASYPTYDLNSPPKNDPDKRRFRPVMDALELGSVVKPLFISYALDKGVIGPNEKLYCENGVYKIPGGSIHDTHKYGWLSVQEIIKVSSNICTYKIVKRLGKEDFNDAIVRSGLARFPGSGLPGEWAGRVLPIDKWREMRFANMSFGQGIAISPLMMTKSLVALTGGGTEKGIRLLADKALVPPMGPPLRFVSPETSRLVTNMMRSVTEEEDGTGKLASIPGTSVAGKTGTAQKYDPKTKKYSERIASFVGVFPAREPRIAITVVIDEVQVRPAYGGLLAGPVFSEIGEKTLQYLSAVGLLAVKDSK